MDTVKIKLFQKLYLPTALIGGFLALAFGTYGFNVIPEDIMKTWAALPGNLINIVFACIFLGATVPKPKDIWEKGGSQLTYSWFIDSIQWILGIGLVAYVIGPIWRIPAYVGSIIEIGWSGGHGTAGGMIEVFKKLGFPDAGDLGMTSATIGLIFGIVMGMVLITMYIAPKMLPNDWFERGIAEFGALCGVLAIGLLLLRVTQTLNSKHRHLRRLLMKDLSSVHLLAVG